MKARDLTLVVEALARQLNLAQAPSSNLFLPYLSTASNQSNIISKIQHHF